MYNPMKPVRVTTEPHRGRNRLSGDYIFIIWLQSGIPQRSRVTFKSEAEARKMGEKVLANKLAKWN